MDLAFHLRGVRSPNRTVGPRVDYDLLVAALGAKQSRSAAARAAREPGGRSGPASRVTELVLGGGEWEEAKRAQGGCFHPRDDRPDREGGGAAAT